VVGLSVTALLDTPPASMPTIGASEVAAILTDREGRSLSPFASPWDVWMRLHGLVARYDTAETGPMAAGNVMEPGIGLRYAKLHDLVVGVHFQAGPSIGQPPIVRKDRPWMSCRPDFFAMPPVDEARLVEAKAPERFDEDQWGPEGTDLAPIAYRCQAVWQMAVTDWNRVDIAAMSRTRGEWRVYVLRRNERVERAVVARVADWYERHVIEGAPPMIDGSPACARALAKLHPGRGERVYVDATAEDLALARDIARLRAQIAELETAKATHENALKARIGDAYGMRGPDGRSIATWAPRRGSQRIDLDRLRRERPDIVSAYAEHGAETRSFRFNHEES
jgi:hypothetical protein